jgi:RNA polymerase sigma-B factor
VVTEFTREHRRAPSVDEIAAVVGSDREDVLEALQADRAYHATSLDAPRGGAHDEPDATVADTVGGPDDGYAQAEHRAVLEQLMRSLNDRERAVVRLRFEEDLTQAEIGERIGVSQMQVSRILRQALQRLHDLAYPERHTAASPVRASSLGWQRTSWRRGPAHPSTPFPKDAT